MVRLNQAWALLKPKEKKKSLLCPKISYWPKYSTAENFFYCTFTV